MIYPSLARGELLPPDRVIEADDMGAISAPIDFLGVNYYRPHDVRAADRNGSHSDSDPLPGHPGFVTYVPAGMQRTPMGWLIEPAALYDQLMAISALAPGLRLYITENGCAAADYIDPNGQVDDVERVAYLRGHFEAAWRAIQDGVNLDGYFVWSLLDNFEWAWGYQQRFGLVYVEFESQRRVVKQSGRFFAEVAAANALPADGSPDELKHAAAHAIRQQVTSRALGRSH